MSNIRFFIAPILSLLAAVGVLIGLQHIIIIPEGFQPDDSRAIIATTKLSTERARIEELLSRYHKGDTTVLPELDHLICHVPVLISFVTDAKERNRLWAEWREFKETHVDLPEPPPDWSPLIPKP